MSRSQPVLGVILAGGRSRRMFPHAPQRRIDAPRSASGHADKGLLDLGGRPMIAHVAARLAPQVERLIVNANGDASRYHQLGLDVVADDPDDNLGPLAGLLTAMSWAERHTPGIERLVTVSADAPFIPTDLVARLATHVPPMGLALAVSSDNVHPVIGLWPIALRADLAAALADGIRAVRAWTDRHPTALVAFDPLAIGTEHADPFFNANTPEDLAEARRLLNLMSEHPTSRPAAQTAP